MKEIVRKEPQEPVSGAIRTVRKNYAEIYDEDDDIFDHIIAELGPDKPIEKQLLRVREEIIGKSPINRNKFDKSKKAQVDKSIQTLQTKFARDRAGENMKF